MEANMKPRFLVVDDEECIRYTFETFLSEEGYEVSVAWNYEEALENISCYEFDVIFTDIVLGGKTGVDLLRAVKEKNLTSPVIMVTGYPNMTTATEAVRLGAFDYISKPVNQETLIRSAKTALEHKRIIDEKERYRKNLEAIFRSVKEGIITVDRDLKVTGVNESAKKMGSLKEDFTGKEFKCLRNNKTECEETLKKAITENKSMELYRIECPLPGNPEKIVSINITPLIGRKDQVCGAVMVIRDETRLVNLEKTLQERREFHNITGKNKKMQEIYHLIEELAPVPTTVLITGESGTGKELIADALHYRGTRRGGPFIKVNCSALPENLLESELFGHVKGAFTGAIKDKTGRFQLADGGSIFLDETGDISPALQVRLLRVLQEKEFERVGDSKPVKVDVRIIAATNKNLMEKVKRGEFREDLYYRLKVVEINLPPLRERKEDIPLLIKHFIKKFNKKFGKDICDVSRDVRKIFLDYNWPGNIRELEHAMEHSFVLCRDSLITTEDLPADLKNYKNNETTKYDVLKDEKENILNALEKTAWNKAKAARLLGISRRTIYRKIEEYNISL